MNNNNYHDESSYHTPSQYPPTIYNSPVNQTPEVKKKSGKGKKAVQAVCMLTAVALVGTAGGFGGSVLYNTMNPQSASIVTTTLNNESDIAATPTNSSNSNQNLSVAQIAEMAQPSVVEIVTEVVSEGYFNQSYVGTGAGSGVIISEDGYIVTNHHVIEGASGITVKTIDGVSHEAKLIGTDSETDLAVLKINADGLTAATIGSSSDLTIGDYVMAIGNPLGELGGTVTDGIVSALSREITIEDETMTLLQTTAAINPGNSGGGLFNENGELIAVVNAKSSGVEIEGIGFAIPIDIAMDVIEDLMDVGYVQGRFTLGVGLIEINDEDTAMMYRVSELGVYIQNITQGGNAHIAGLQVGDRIVEFNDKEITTNDELLAEIENLEANDTVDVIVERNGQLVIINMLLAEETTEGIQEVRS